MQALKRQKKAARKARSQGQDDSAEVQLGQGSDSADQSSGDDEDIDPAAAEATRRETARRLKQIAKEHKSRAVLAHAGMRVAKDKSGQAAIGPQNVGALTLADQEAIALRILGAQAQR